MIFSRLGIDKFGAASPCKGYLLAVALPLATVLPSSALAQSSSATVIDGVAKRPAGIYPCLQDDINVPRDGANFVECVTASRPLTDLVRKRNAEIAIAPNEVGCIERDVITCMATLASRSRITSSIAGSMTGELIYKSPKSDIYGKKQPQIYSFQIAPFSTDPSTHIPATIYSANGGDLTNIEFFLDRSPLTAHSLSDWDQTAVYELAHAVLGDCIGTDKSAFYRTYDAAQHSGSASKSINDSYTDPGVTSGVHGSFKICNARISTTSASGVSIGLGAWHGATMTIEAAVPTTPLANGPSKRR